MKKGENTKDAAVHDLTRKEDVNRLRGTVEFIDPEKGPTHKGKEKDNRGNHQ